VEQIQLLFVDLQHIALEGLFVNIFEDGFQQRSIPKIDQFAHNPDNLGLDSHIVGRSRKERVFDATQLFVESL